MMSRFSTSTLLLSLLLLCAVRPAFASGTGASPLGQVSADADLAWKDTVIPAVKADGSCGLTGAELLATAGIGIFEAVPAAAMALLSEKNKETLSKGSFKLTHAMAKIAGNQAMTCEQKMQALKDSSQSALNEIDYNNAIAESQNERLSGSLTKNAAGTADADFAGALAASGQAR